MVQPFMGWVGNEGVDVQEPINCRDVRPVSSPVTVTDYVDDIIECLVFEKNY